MRAASINLFVTTLCWLVGFQLLGSTVESDICIYGGTSAGVIAAVQGAKMDERVVVIEPGKHLGGMTASGLGWTDIGNKDAIGGLSREFYRQLGKHYGKFEAWTFEPHVAEQEFVAMLAESKTPVYFQQKLDAVKKVGARISEIITEDGSVFRAKMFIDATYEGDLMAKAGVSYFVGREANSTYGETLNGIRHATPKNQLLVPVDAFVIAGDTNSGLLPLVQAGELGISGGGDKCVQAYNYRLCLTKNPANRKPIEPPPNYDPKQYELLGRYFDALAAAGKTVTLRNFIKLDMVTRDKTDSNNSGGFSTDFIGMSNDYPDGDEATRKKFQADCLNYTKGFLTYLATSPRVPPSIRKEMQEWGLCRNEFQDTDGWPNQLYVREARRMISDYVMTEKNCRQDVVAVDSIGLAAYSMDSHNCRRIARNGKVENEGDVQAPSTSPYPISYRSIVPRAEQCENLLIPVCLAASHIAYGSIRMEPVFMTMGQAAATAAALAIDEKVSVQKVDYPKLRDCLIAGKQVLEWKTNSPANISK